VLADDGELTRASVDGILEVLASDKTASLDVQMLHALISAARDGHAENVEAMLREAVAQLRGDGAHTLNDIGM
jgi:hypothetical protein